MSLYRPLGDNVYLGLNKDLPFPVLTDDTAMRAATAEKTEIRYMEQPNGTTVCCYIVATNETFNDPYSCEARGLVFDKDGAVISRPLHKFFNVNERESTKADKLDWSKVTRCMVKRDGSMIHTVKFPTTDWMEVQAGVSIKPFAFSLKSKKSFTSDVAKQALKWMVDTLHVNRGNAYVRFCEYCVANDLTAIFEWTSPRARIVVGYSVEDLQLLHVRENQTGRYLSIDEMKTILAKFEEFTHADGEPLKYPAVIPVVENDDRALEMLKEGKFEELVATTEGMEGWVVQFENGDMVKIKTKWYMDRHHIMTFPRRRDIARSVLDEALDDLKSMLVGDGVDITEILAIEHEVLTYVREIEASVDATYAPDKDLDRKTFAIKHKEHPHFSMLMQKFSGKEPDVKEYFRRKFLDEKFDLEQINLMNSVAEVE